MASQQAGCTTFENPQDGNGHRDAKLAVQYSTLHGLWCLDLSRARAKDNIDANK
jgi:hypothetical protein